MLSDRNFSDPQRVANSHGSFRFVAEIVSINSLSIQTLEVAQYLYIVLQSFQVYASVAAFFAKLRKPDLLENLQECLEHDTDALAASSMQLRDIADTLSTILSQKRCVCF